MILSSLSPNPKSPVLGLKGLDFGQLYDQKGHDHHHPPPNSKVSKSNSPHSKFQGYIDRTLADNKIKRATTTSHPLTQKSQKCFQEV